MAAFDLPWEELQTYAPSVSEPEDFDAFWEQTLRESESFSLDLAMQPVDTGITAVRTWDVVFAGFGGHPIHAWLHLPAGAADPNSLPAIVHYRGYGGGRGLAHENILWAAAGYACLICDTRGQGSGWSTGETADPVGSAPAHPGFMTRGILEPHDYYYRRVFVDAVRAVSVIGGQAEVDRARVAVTGRSQGGGIALAVAALSGEVAAVMPDVPFLCNFPRALDLADTDPYTEVVRYLKVHRDHREPALRTLAYFDGVNFSRRARVPALFSVALMDEICPPSTVYSAYNVYAGPKEIGVYHYNDHEGGGEFHEVEQLRWLRERLMR